MRLLALSFLLLLSFDLHASTHHGAGALPDDSWYQSSGARLDAAAGFALHTPPRITRTDENTWRKGRVILFDTETTGGDAGAQIVQFCGFEMIDGKFTGEVFNVYLNPKTPSNRHAFKAHDLSEDFLKDKQTFSQAFPALKQFIGDSPLMAHNEHFDLRMLLQEYARLKTGETWNLTAYCTLGKVRRDYHRTLPQTFSLCSPATRTVILREPTTQERHEKETEKSNVAHKRDRTEWEREERYMVATHFALGDTRTSPNSRKQARTNRPAVATDRNRARPPIIPFAFKAPYSFKLEECVTRTGISPEQAVENAGVDFNALAEAAGIPVERRKAHDAFYDVAMLLALVQSWIQIGWLPEATPAPAQENTVTNSVVAPMSPVRAPAAAAAAMMTPPMMAPPGSDGLRFNRRTAGQPLRFRLGDDD